MSAMGGFHDFLFEMSNEYRYNILLLLCEKPMRISDLTREIKFTTAEVRRHVSRLAEVGLIQRDTEGYYLLTPYGESSLLLLQEFIFLSTNREYFQTHTLSEIPSRFVKRIGELKASTNLANAMDFLRFMENLLKESKEYVWLLVDQFPMNSLSSIVEAIERGVQFRIIEPRERILYPDIESMTSEEAQALSRARQTPLVDQRMVDDVNVYLFLSDNRCVIAFTTPEGQYDYMGFTATDGSSLQWCRELFQHYWDEAENRDSPSPLVQVEIIRRSRDSGLDRVVVNGRGRQEIDAPALQDALDNYNEVILSGEFNLGTSTIFINRSVKIRGEGSESGIPSTKIFKKGWKFPDFQEEFLFVINGEEIDVTIENIHFNDFNGYCIWVRQANSIEIRNNRITLHTGIGRGWTRGTWGDFIFGINIGGPNYAEGICPGGVVIEGNYLDFATSFILGGYYFSDDLDDPNYRPELSNHYNYVGIGIVIRMNLGEVIVKDNIIRNINAKAIHVGDNFDSSTIHIVNNTIISEVYGSYSAIYGSYSRLHPFSGVGVFVRSANLHQNTRTSVFIEGNEIRCEKINYCGIAVCGPVEYIESSEKIEECRIKDNDIYLHNGSVCIYVKESDRTEIVNNKISGNAYYGIQISGTKRRSFDLGAYDNVVEDNDMEELVINEPDEYSDSHVDGRLFTGSQGRSATAHVWLNALSRGNVITVRADETVIDEGEGNTVERVEDQP